MTEQTTRKGEVGVSCLGISDKTGFSLSPVGFEATYIEFEPGKPTMMKRHYAEYLTAQDPCKFILLEEKPGEARDKKAGKLK